MSRFFRWMSHPQLTVWHLVAYTVGLALALALTGCAGDGDEPQPSGEYSSECDEHGNRVYVGQDDVRAAPSIFVVPGDPTCEEGSS